MHVFFSHRFCRYRPDPTTPTTGKWYVPKDTLANGRGEACGGFLNINDATVFLICRIIFCGCLINTHQGTKENVIIAGGREYNAVNILSSVEFIGPDDSVAMQQQQLSVPRFGCAGVSNPQRQAVFIVGGISSSVDGSGKVVFAAVATVERIRPDGLTTLASPGAIRSHMAVVEAPPYAFFIVSFVSKKNSKNRTIVCSTISF